MTFELQNLTIQHFKDFETLLLTFRAFFCMLAMLARHCGELLRICQKSFALSEWSALHTV